MKLSLRIDLLSDTCFSGASAGRVGDADTSCEADVETGLPIIRGRTLKGLLVEEAAIILHALEPAASGPWHRTCQRLFGSSGRSKNAALSFGQATLSPKLVEAVRENTNNAKGGRWLPSEVSQALSVVRRQTKLDAKTGAAEPHSLRSTRLVRAGHRFHGPIRIRRPLNQAERAMLAACAAGLRRGGLHRNRGWGHLRVGLVADESDVTAEWLAAFGDATAAEGDRTSPAPDNGQTKTYTRSKVVTYRLKLREPVILASSDGDPSTVESLPYISGSSVLGAAAQRWLRTRQNGTDPAVDPTFTDCFLDGTVRWLNAYPEGRGKTRLLPIPRTLVTRKRELGSVHWSVFDQASAEFSETRQDEPDTQWKPIGKTPFVVLSSTDDDMFACEGRDTRRSPRLHHMRDDREAGRSKDGAIFSYFAIEAGESFIGHVLCDDEQQSDVVQRLLAGGPIALGRSRTATYGGWAEVEVWTDGASQWREVPGSVADKDEPKRVVVTLLSDYLGVSESGQPEPEALEREVGAALGIDIAPVACFLAPKDVSGYVSKWRMPRPRHPAIAAGSVLVFDGVTVDRARVAALEWAGLGIRRAEGFGRVAVNWHGVLELAGSSFVRPLALTPRDDDDRRPLRFLENQLLFDAVHRALTDEGAKQASRVSRRPSPSLVSRVRGRVRTADEAGDISAFFDELRSDRGNKKAEQALKRARVSGQPLHEWVEETAKGGWDAVASVGTEVTRLGLELSRLDDSQRWQLLQTYLDVFLETLRRLAVGDKTVASRGGAE